MIVTLEKHNDVGVILIDDGNKNVINHQVLDELEPTFAEAERDTKAIVISGRPGSFCAGYDISVMTGDDPGAASELGLRGGKFAHQLYSSKNPLLAVSTGHAFTIGAIWLACCDIRIGEKGNYKYCMSEVKLGVPFGAWPLQPLKARLSPAHQIEALLHSKPYPPEEAVAAGYIDQLTEPGAGLAVAIDKAKVLARLPQSAYAKSKLQLREEALSVMAADLGL